MKPTLQTTFGNEGNCLCACIASLLEIPIDSIPNPKCHDWQNEINKWLIANHDVYLLTARINGVLPMIFKKGLVIGVGKTPSGLDHAVICCGDKIIFDPLPGSGLTFNEVIEYDILVKYFSNQ